MENDDFKILIGKLIEQVEEGRRIDERLIEELKTKVSRQDFDEMKEVISRVNENHRVLEQTLNKFLTDSEAKALAKKIIAENEDKAHKDKANGIDLSKKQLQWLAALLGLIAAAAVLWNISKGG